MFFHFIKSTLTKSIEESFYKKKNLIAKRQEAALEQPESQRAQEQTQSIPRPEQEDQEILLLAVPSNTATESDISASDINTEVIPQLDGHSEAPEKKSFVEQEEPVIFKMLENGYAETKLIAPGETPPARFFHPELRIGTQPRQSEWGDRVWIEYVFEVGGILSTL